MYVHLYTNFFFFIYIQERKEGQGKGNHAEGFIRTLFSRKLHCLYINNINCVYIIDVELSSISMCVYFFMDF
uniref:Putative ovule protein n=1 Tax=Solanum chacoense TaxID=4108 RepID=A0A0V0GVZ0_SOLCH